MTADRPTTDRYHDHPRPFCGEGCPAYGNAWAKYRRAEAAQGAAPLTHRHYPGNTGAATHLGCGEPLDLSEGAAPRAEGLDVERIRGMAIYVEKYDRDMVPLDDVLAVLDNFVPVDNDADGQARAILARLSRPSDEREP